MGGEVRHNDVYADGDGENAELTAEEYEAIMSFYNWVKEANPKFSITEHTVFNSEIGYGGTLDAIAEIDGKTYIIDFKTSKDVYLSHEVQIASYLHCDNIKADNMAILQLGYNKNKKKFKFTEIEDKFNLFLSAYGFWKEENENKQPHQKDYPTSIKLGV